MRPILFLLILLPAILKSQSCLPGGITFSSQADIDDFATNYPGCTEILGNVFIEESLSGNIVDLSSLAQITAINGVFYIENNSALNSLSGLDNLQVLGSALRIAGNDQLTSMSALSNISQTGGFLVINQNNQLTNLDGLHNIQSVAGFLGVFDNPLLDNIDGLNSLTSLGFSLVIINNDMLTDLDGLLNLTSIGDGIAIRDNAILSDITGISNIDPLSINSSSSSVEDITIYNNPLLSTCEVQSICDALLLSGTTTDIHDNAVGCNSETEVQAACDAVLPVTWLSPLTATLYKNNVHLSWTVGLQENNKEFIIEWSVDGKRFQTVEIIPRSINNELVQEFRSWHKSPMNGDNYYRIQQIDHNGQGSYSNIAEISFSNESLSVYPNPFLSTCTISSTKSSNLDLITAQGKVIEQLSIDRGVQTLNLSHLKRGVFFFRFEYGEILKLVKR